MHITISTRAKSNKNQMKREKNDTQAHTHTVKEAETFFSYIHR